MVVSGDHPAYDVAVIGLGTAGAACAAFLAEAGLAVVGLDRRPLDGAGARWVNGVPAWMFDEAGVDRPTGEELRGAGHPFHLVCGAGPTRVVIEDTGVLEVDMRALVARLQDRARAAGAILIAETRVEGHEGDVLRTSGGDIRATTIVDASGVGGAGLLPSSAPAAVHVCAAAQAVHQVVDEAAASAFADRHRVRRGETLCFTGIAGGFSILNVRIQGDTVSILTGSIPALGHPSGKAMLDRFVKEQQWIGEAHFGGARAIPLSRPVDLLVQGSVALLGDAARQVFTVHGSGIGLGMLAARTLAHTLAAGEPLDAYRVRWMRTYGALQGTYEVFRRFSATLQIEDIRTLIEAGLMNARTASPTMAQRWPTFDPRALITGARGAWSAPRLASRLGIVGARMAAVRAIYGAHPRDPSKVGRWSRHLDRLLPP
jgi:flavin-dependent dehydrogenase